MRPEVLNAVAVALPLALATLTPTDALACAEAICKDVDFWSGLMPTNADKIPADGVLVLSGFHNHGDDEDSLDRFALEVTLDGQPIAGALETTSVHGALVWRPAEPWQAGKTYKLGGTFDNPENDPDGYYNCAEDVVFDADLVIDAAPGCAFEAAPFVVNNSEVQSIEPITLETLACCEGASPTRQSDGCFGFFYEYDEAQCGAAFTLGKLFLYVQSPFAATGPISKQLVYTVTVDGVPEQTSFFPEFTLYLDAPACVVFEAMDLASGTVSKSPEQCFGMDVADQLGQQPNDALPKCELFQCEPTEEGWDLTKCTALDPVDPPTEGGGEGSSDGASGSSGSDSGAGADDAKGCACATAPAGAPGWLALVGLLALGRRRRPSRRRRAV